MNSYFLLSVILLALLLFFPTSRMIWVLSVRRAEGRLNRKLAAGEIAGQRSRARLIALLLVFPFSWLFNIQLLNRLYG